MAQKESKLKKVEFTLRTSATKVMQSTSIAGIFDLKIQNG